MLKERIEKFISTYFIAHQGDKSYILLFKPYCPYLKSPRGYAYINAFYPASNELYFISKNLERELEDYNANIYKGALKSLFLDFQCGILLRNGLIAIPPFGTRIALAAVESKRLPVEEKLGGFIQQNRLCSDCELCQNHCPTGALDGDVFKKERCLRYASDHADETSVDLALMQKSILGCDACQDVCPYNVSVPNVSMPDDLFKLMKMDKLIERAEGGRKELEELCFFVGNNYNRPKRILKLAKIAKDYDDGTNDA